MNNRPKISNSMKIVYVLIAIIVVLVLGVGYEMYNHSAMGTNVASTLTGTTWTIKSNLPGDKGIAHDAKFKNGEETDSSSNQPTTCHLSRHTIAINDGNDENVTLKLTKVNGNAYHFGVDNVNGKKFIDNSNQIDMGHFKINKQNNTLYDDKNGRTMHVPNRVVDGLNDAMSNAIIIEH